MSAPVTPSERQYTPGSEHGIDNIQPGSRDAPIENFRPMRVVVIGAGFSGIYCGVRIPERLRNIDLCIYEKNAGIGGTWYPGVACDIPSHSYQYTFAPNPNWSTLYASGEEIRQYLDHVAKRYSVDRFVKLSHQVVDAEWQSGTAKWLLKVKNLTTGEVLSDQADVVIGARGTLNDKKWPSIPGLGDVTVPVIHSAEWDQSQSFEGKKVAVIGGGSSAIQIVPSLQKLEGIHITSFIRSKTWISRQLADFSMQKLGLDDVNFTLEQRAKFAADPEQYLEFRTTLERDANSFHSLTLKGSALQTQAREGFTQLMRKRLAKKPEILDILLPDFSVGCRRITPGPGYLEALVSDNVDVVSTPITRAHATGLELQDGRKLDFDVVVCATGFHAASAPPFRVAGMDGQELKARFDPFPETYLSMVTDGFPKYFMMLGPNAGIGTGPLTPMMEMAGDYIVKCIRKMQKENIAKMEVQKRRVKDFSEMATQYFKGTVYLDGCSSWYRSQGGTGDRISGLWPGSALHAMEAFRSPRWEDFDYIYEGENEDGTGAQVNRLGWLGNGWSVAQMEDGGVGELAHFLQPEHVDIPAAPFPEETRVYQQRPFSY